MKTAKQWFDEYAVSHQNETNKLIHFICVPVIFYSVIGLLMSIPTILIEDLLGLYNPLIENWAGSNWNSNFFFLLGFRLLVFFGNGIDHTTMYYW